MENKPQIVGHVLAARCQVDQILRSDSDGPSQRMKPTTFSAAPLAKQQRMILRLG